MQSRLLMQLLGEMRIDATAVQSQDLYFGLAELQKMGTEYGIPMLCANLLDANEKPVFPGYRVFEMGGKQLGVLSVTDPQFQQAAELLKDGLHFADPAAYIESGVKELREQKGCDAVVLLFGGRRDQALEICKDMKGIDLILFGNATISQRVPAETNSGIPLYTAAARGKDFGNLTLTMKDDGTVELSPIEIHELDQNYPDDPAIKEEVDAFKAEKDERVKRARLIEEMAHAFSDSSITETYIGTDLCRRCHEAEYQIFKDTAHAHALASLEKTFEETKPECVACHVTGWQTPGGYGLDQRNREILKSVQCEACHGYGTTHSRDAASSSLAAAEAQCRVCHDKANSPNFDFDKYWKKIAH
jgi:2',3'-cyclic-nucleotide 2'-phosphodiesterase (5'-nucleotidase family)